MLTWLVLAGSWIGGAEAAPPERNTRQFRLGPFSNTPLDDLKEKREQEKSEEEKAREERRKAIEAKLAKEHQVRVVVLQERPTDVDYTNETLRRNVKVRINRPNAKFYPDIDLYQNGRKERDPTLRPLDQRARVPDEVIDQINEAWRSVSAIPWNAIDETAWGEKAAALKSLADSVWFIDRPELRAPLFNLYVQIGNAAENSNNPLPPFFEQVAGIDVNYYFYQAAAMAARTPELMSQLTDQDLYAEVDHLRQRIMAGEFAPMTLNFELGGEFDPAVFNTDYIVYFNGVPDIVSNELYNVPPGRMDVFLERTDDGYGMSVRVQAIKVDDQDLESVRDQARKRMGIDFIEQLMENPEECIPDVEGDIINYLAIYQKLHPKQEIYIAVPYLGSAHRIYLWRWDPNQGVLKQVGDNTGGFPVRFVGLVGSGLSFNGMTVVDPTAQESVFTPPTNTDDIGDIPEFQDLFKPKASSIPISYELRGHYSRLMVALTADASLNIRDGKWREIPATRTHEHIVEESGNVLADRILVEGDGDTTPYVIERTFQRGLFVTVAGVLGRDASSGFGPRFGIRGGIYNAPRAAEFTGRVGWSIPMARKDAKNDRADTRVKGILDTDLYAGAVATYGDTLSNLGVRQDIDGNWTVWGRIRKGTERSTGPMGPLNDDGIGAGAAICTADIAGCEVRKIGVVSPTFGFVVRAGLTF